jgi:hypothetical protein
VVKLDIILSTSANLSIIFLCAGLSATVVELLLAVMVELLLAVVLAAEISALVFDLGPQKL